MVVVIIPIPNYMPSLCKLRVRVEERRVLRAASQIRGWGLGFAVHASGAFIAGHRHGSLDIRGCRGRLRPLCFQA